MSNKHLENILKIANKYVDEDISIVPIKIKQKELNYKSLREVISSKGFNLATIIPYLDRLPTNAELTAWFSSKENTIAIVTGYKDTICIDFDDKESFETWKNEYPDVFQNTPVQKTFRGYHVFLKTKAKIDTSKASFKGKIIGDIEGYRDFVIVYPSIHPSGVMYEWLKDHEPWKK